MRILFDSKQSRFKSPFGTLTPEQACTLHIYIPAELLTTRVELLLCREDKTELSSTGLVWCRSEEGYDVFRGALRLEAPGLYYYYFRIHAHTGPFRLFRWGDETNMEDGDYWQVSCLPRDYATPRWSQGAICYQIFPDRFCSRGAVETRGKLEPFTLHSDWLEEVSWQPTKEGIIENNDFFGGNFQGIMEKLPYLASLGVSLIYLNPISKSFSNHRYDTGDYLQPDPMLGTEEAFRELCRQAHSLGIRVILDGVFSHTGSNSLYFNRQGAFPSVGAYQSRDSRYHPWYRFHSWPEEYDAWWGFDTLPTVNKRNEDYLDFIILGENSVVAHWLALGCDGFRLDVADELPDEFIRLLRDRVKGLKPEALVLGEVWEDASNKVSYGVRRQYFTGEELDGVMNYPIRSALIAYLRGYDDGSGLKTTVMTLAENYPPQALNSTLTLLGTHDTPRILTALVDDFDGSLEERAHRRLGRQQWVEALERLKVASFLQFTLPGAATIYYGDEAGLEGHKDPFNRRPFPWGQENRELQAHYRRLGRLRREHTALQVGALRFFAAGDGRIGFRRQEGANAISVYCNRSEGCWELPYGRVLLGESLDRISPEGLVLGPGGYCAVEEG